MAIQQETQIIVNPWSDPWYLYYKIDWPEVTPSIAQLVERRTVECVESSLGRWFESGSKEIFFSEILL